MIVLGLGTNLGDRENNLRLALRLLTQNYEIEITHISSIYETAPFGVTDQPDFLNLTVAINTDMNPQTLLKSCLDVEEQMGRVRIQRWGPRVIDIDLLLYHDTRIDSPSLTLPHPGILQREFVIIPLHEMAPSLIMPNGKTVAAVAAEFSRNGDAVRLWKADVWDANLKRFK